MIWALKVAGIHGKWGDHLQITSEKDLIKELLQKKWRELFPNHEIQHLTSPVSDHSPILVCMEKHRHCTQRNRRKKVHFEAMWFKEEESEVIINNCWDSGEHNTFMEKVNTIRENLQ